MPFYGTTPPNRQGFGALQVSEIPAVARAKGLAALFRGVFSHFRGPAVYLSASVTAEDAETAEIFPGLLLRVGRQNPALCPVFLGNIIEHDYGRFRRGVGYGYHRLRYHTGQFRLLGMCSARPHLDPY